MSVFVPALGSNTPATLEYTDSLPEGSKVVIDVRPESLCQQTTLDHAVCIPPEHFTSPADRLANFPGILWLLGTAALDGTEQVVVAGNNALRKEFVAGVLHLAGQSSIQVLIPAVESLLKAGEPASPGRLRSTLRTSVYKSTMRASQIVLRNELAQLLTTATAVTLLDGRREAEYWGHLIHGSRGGHIPGAVHSPIDSWSVPPRPQSGMPYSQGVIAYAHDSRQSIAYYARLVAHGIPARVLHEGWAGWAQDGQLPVDAASYARQRNQGVTPEPDELTKPANSGRSWTGRPLLNTVLVMLLLIAGVATGYWLRGRGIKHHD